MSDSRAIWSWQGLTIAMLIRIPLMAKCTVYNNASRWHCCRDILTTWLTQYIILTHVLQGRRDLKRSAKGQSKDVQYDCWWHLLHFIQRKLGLDQTNYAPYCIFASNLALCVFNSIVLADCDLSSAPAFSEAIIKSLIKIWERAKYRSFNTKI